MTGSSWKSYLDPQIATRNRWADHSYARPGEVGRAGQETGHDSRSRGLGAVAAVALTVAAVVLFFVIALHSTRPEPLFTVAPAAPAAHSMSADSAGHAAAGDAPTSLSAGGGGTDHALAQ